MEVKIRYTLLELVQRILGSMEADEVSSIGETPESTDVAAIIKECYFDIVGQQNLQEHEGIFRLDAGTDDTKPVLMYVPENVMQIEWLKYDISPDLTRPDLKNLCFLENHEFFDYQSGRDDSDPSVSSMSFEVNGKTFYTQFLNDKFPTYYSIFDERVILFDAYDSTVEDTLTETRSFGYGRVVPEFRMENSFIPDLDPRQFQLLLQDAKSTAHIELKQQANPKAEAKYRRNIILAQRTRDDNDPRASQQKSIRYGRAQRGRVRTIRF